MRLSPLELAAIDELRNRPQRLSALERSLLDAIAEAGGIAPLGIEDSPALHAGMPTFEYLTPRENEILRLVVDGETNRSAGARLGISPRTVELHRSRIIKKFHARSTTDLIRIVMEKVAGASGQPGPAEAGQED